MTDNNVVHQWMACLISLWLSMLPTMLAADSWVEPRDSAVASPDGSFVLRVDLNPETSGGGVRFHSRALWFQWNEIEQRYQKIREIALTQFVAPTKALISNDGDVAMIGAWYGDANARNPGTVIWLYSVDGRLIKQWTLAQLYPSDAVSKLPRSTSRVHWVADTPSINRQTLTVPESLGGRFEFDLVTGKYVYLPASALEIVRHPGFSFLGWLLALGALILLARLIWLRWRRAPSVVP